MSSVQWAQWLGATFVASLTLVGSLAAYAHSTFITVREKLDLINRLDRIESKIDRIESSVHANDYFQNRPNTKRPPKVQQKRLRIHPVENT